MELSDPSLYLNRELSLLEFHRRVLHQARDSGTPLLERLRFLAICTTNLDEFFEIRVAGLKQQVAHGLMEPGPDGTPPAEILRLVGERVHELVTEQYRVFNDDLLPALSAVGVHFLRRPTWTPDVKAWAQGYFREQVLPVLTPIALDPAHPFPRILNKSLNFIVALEGTDAYGRAGRVAVVQAPRSLPRVIAVPAQFASSGHAFALLSAIVHEFVGDLFAGMQVKGAWQFRVTRNSDLWVDEEAVDLLSAIKGELTSRAYGDAVRLEVADNCPDEMAAYLLTQFHLEPRDLYRVNGPVNLHRLAAVYDQINRPDLKFPPFTPGIPWAQGRRDNLFDRIRQSDVLLHHPYQSFAPVVELARQAAADPDVLSIKLTLYRTGEDSPLVGALIDAARAGKDVTAVVELRARFNEAANIDLATRLQEAGANVAYGVVGFKAHAKMMLILRREGGKLRRYIHLGTGNYHPGTARAYTDFSLFTCAKDLCRDVHGLFLQLTGLGRLGSSSKLLQAPFTLERGVMELIEHEIEFARQGKPARIAAKMNSLSDAAMIRALYRASQAGVKVDLIVRGICCLRPGVPGVSDNIRVRSIVGRFLEHSRVYYFLAGGRELTFCASADWMQRNLHHRVETCFPIEDETLRARVIEEALTQYLNDGVQAWELGRDGHYAAPTGGGAAAQHVLLERYSAR